MTPMGRPAPRQHSPRPWFSDADGGRVSEARRRAVGSRMVCESDQRTHAPGLRKRRERLHALHRHRAAGEFRNVTRAHVIAWRDDLKTRLTRRGEPWSDASIRHRLSALAALFEYLCDRNAVTHNPVAQPWRRSGDRYDRQTCYVPPCQAASEVAWFPDALRP